MDISIILVIVIIVLVAALFAISFVKRKKFNGELSQMREESLSNKLVDGKQNPVGVIACLNRHYNWSSPFTADANRNKSSLTAAELPKLNGGKVLELPNNSQENG